MKALEATDFLTEASAGKEEIRVKLHLEHEKYPEIEIVLYRYDGSSCIAFLDGEVFAMVERSAVVYGRFAALAASLRSVASSAHFRHAAR